MMQMNYVYAALGFAAAGAIAWELTTQMPLAHAVIGVDPSASVVSNCVGVTESVRALLSDKPEFRDGSTLTMLAMGSAQPVLLYQGALPIEPDIFYGTDKGAFRKAEADFYTNVEVSCAGAKPVRKSPIYRLVNDGIAHLRAMGCTAKSRCLLLLKSDLLDDSDERIAAALSVDDSSEPVSGEPAASIDNAGIEFIVCGLEEVHTGPGKAHTPGMDRRIAVWKNLLTHPDLSRFSPFCGQPAK